MTTLNLYDCLCDWTWGAYGWALIRGNPWRRLCGTLNAMRYALGAQRNWIADKQYWERKRLTYIMRYPDRRWTREVLPNGDIQCGWIRDGARRQLWHD